MNDYPKILPFYMAYPMPVIWEEEDTVMRDLEYLQELYPRQAKKYRKRIEELLERFDSKGSVLYDEYPDRMTLYKMAQDIYAVLEQEKKREQAEAAAPLGPESMELIQVLLYGEIFRRRQKKGFRKF